MIYQGDELYWIAICDDEKDSAREIKSILLEYEVEPGDFHIKSFESGEELLNANLARYDLLVLDIMFPTGNGRNIAKEYRSQNENGLFVFCTGKASPIPEDFIYHPYRFMRKEKRKQMREYLLETVDEMYRRRYSPQLPLTEGKRNVMLNIRDILYIEIAKNGSNVYYFDKEKEMQVMKVREKVKELYSCVHMHGFEYAHNSYLVNCNYLKQWDSHELELVNGIRMSVSRSKEKAFRDACMKYIV
ncbi:MAG: LytTR family DNA-binding domain-containing protein [Bacillus sp. (in: Bacteria)]|nr:LytTR family DNA-binding domain-containing protein [Bacillus sp. (in: firmicutes)]MCM1426137.1 LytTR family DNA-binding domain-containing protein [Eubacterium sp.]